jgi:hypothetical protein
VAAAGAPAAGRSAPAGRSAAHRPGARGRRRGSARLRAGARPRAAARAGRAARKRPCAHAAGRAAASLRGPPPGPPRRGAPASHAINALRRPRCCWPRRCGSPSTPSRGCATDTCPVRAPARPLCRRRRRPPGQPGGRAPAGEPLTKRCSRRCRALALRPAAAPESNEVPRAACMPLRPPPARGRRSPLFLVTLSPPPDRPCVRAAGRRPAQLCRPGRPRVLGGPAQALRPRLQGARARARPSQQAPH